MSAHQWIVRDPARREELLTLLRAVARMRVIDIAAAMSISRSCALRLLDVMRMSGQVDTAIDQSMRQAPRSGAPLVAWIVASNTKRLGKRIKPRPIGFTKRIEQEIGAQYVHPYAPTGTPTHLAGRIQMMAVQGRAP